MGVKGKIWLFFGLFVVFLAARLPGMLFKEFGSFSPVYALVFCAGVYLGRKSSWWLPLGAMALSDVILNMYYWKNLGWDVWSPSVLRYQLVNYISYVLIILLGKQFKPKSSFFSLLGGGIMGALLFYVITNTASWLFNPFGNPEYNHNFLGWIIAIVKGTGGWPDAWLFFRNTLLSGGIFTALFVAAAKLAATAESPVEKEAGLRAPEKSPEPEELPEEAKA